MIASISGTARGGRGMGQVGKRLPPAPRYKERRCGPRRKDAEHGNKLGNERGKKGDVPAEQHDHHDSDGYIERVVDGRGGTAEECRHGENLDRIGADRDEPSGPDPGGRGCGAWAHDGPHDALRHGGVAGWKFQKEFFTCAAYCPILPPSSYLTVVCSARRDDIAAGEATCGVFCIRVEAHPG